MLSPIFFLIFVFFSGNFAYVWHIHICSSNSSCDIEKFDLCNEGKCDCESWALYDQVLDVCRIKAGHFSNLPTRSCVENAERTEPTGNCFCNLGFKENSDGICILLDSKFKVQDVEDQIENDFYNKTCTSSRDCENPLHILRCFENKCVCHESDIFDQNSKICRARPFSFCFPPKNPCVENATCLSLARFKICNCTDGYEISQNNSACLSIIGYSNGTEKKSRVQNDSLSDFWIAGVILSFVLFGILIIFGLCLYWTS